MGASAIWPLRALRCAVVATAVIGAAGCSTGAAMAQPPTRADQQTAQRVREALAQDQYVYTNQVTVEARGAVVRLSGQVANADELQRVLRIVNAVPGVQQVDDELEIEEFRHSGTN